MIRINDYELPTPDYSTLSDEDKDLIEKSLDSDDWVMVGYYERDAKSEYAREIIHSRKMKLFHKEEAFAGIL